MRRLMKIAPRALSVLMLAILAVAGMAAMSFAQDGRAQLELRVVAQPLSDGRIEFGVEYQGERVLPTARYLTQRLIQQRRGQWLKSTPIEVVGPSLEPPALAGDDGAASPLYRDQNDLWEMRGFGRPVEQVMVAAQPLADGRIEFAIEHDGERIQPDARYLTPQLIADRQEEWLRSSPVVISAAVTPAERVRGVRARARRKRGQVADRVRRPLPAACRCRRGLSAGVGGDCRHPGQRVDIRQQVDLETISLAVGRSGGMACRRPGTRSSRRGSSPKPQHGSASRPVWLHRAGPAVARPGHLVGSGVQLRT